MEAPSLPACLPNQLLPARVPACPPAHFPLWQCKDANCWRCDTKGACQQCKPGYLYNARTKTCTQCKEWSTAVPAQLPVTASSVQLSSSERMNAEWLK